MTKLLLCFLPILMFYPGADGDGKYAERMRLKQKLVHTADLQVFAPAEPAKWEKLGENIGYAISVSRLMELWMASPLHRKNILDPKFKYIGIGVSQDFDPKYFWVSTNFLGLAEGQQIVDGCK